LRETAERAETQQKESREALLSLKKSYGAVRLELPLVLYVVADQDDIPQPLGRLFDLASQKEACSGDELGR